MKARVDQDICIGCGLCETTCPSVFKVNDDDVSDVIASPVPADAVDTCQRAEDGCPVEAISIEE